MNTNQKSEELIGKYNLLVPIEFGGMDKNLAIQCALIAVDEIINSLENYGKESDELQNMENDFRYWQEVRQELLNMK